MIIDARTRKLRKACQELIDSAFKFMRYQQEGSTSFQKTTSTKQFIKAIEEVHEILAGNKIVKIKPPKQVTSYRTDAKMVVIINKDLND